MQKLWKEWLLLCMSWKDFYSNERNYSGMFLFIAHLKQTGEKNHMQAIYSNSILPLFTAQYSEVGLA